MSLVILKRESRANGELFCIELPYQNIKKQRPHPQPRLRVGTCRFYRRGLIFVSLHALKGHENDVLTGISIEFILLMVRGVCTWLD